MASQLSDEEFHRLQTQLIELRTANYGMEEQCTKLRADNKRLGKKLEELERENQKLQKTVNRSKKAKDIDLLIIENESLQVKLEAQEDDFRLQNETLLQELSSLLAANEKFEEELNALKKEDDSWRKLADPVVEADSSILTKKIAEERIKAEQQLGELRETIQSFTVGDTDDQDDSVPSSEGDFVQVGETDVTYQKRGASQTDLLKQAEQKLQNLEAHQKMLTDTVVRLETEQEEKHKIEAELKQTQEKLRRKQESLMQLQDEKENLYVESRKAYEDLQITKEQEINALKEQNQRLQVQLNNTLASLQEYKEKTSQKMDELESKFSVLARKSDNSSEERILEMQAKVIELECVLGETKEELSTARQHKLQYESLFSDAQQKLKEYEALAADWENQRKQLTAALEEVQLLAQKRKSLVDEMSIRIQQKSDDYKHQLSNLTNEFSNKEEILKRQIESLEDELEKLQPLKSQLDDALVQVKSLEAMRGWLERRQKEAEDSVESTRTYYENALEHLKTEHSQEISQLNLHFQNKEEGLEEQLMTALNEVEKKNQIISELEQQVHDAGEEKVLTEKKGAAVLKDLRRQLAAERKRSEKLQERLRDVLNNEGTHTTKMSTELNKAHDPETSSISSWSLMSGNCEHRDSSTRENSISNLNGNVSPPPDDQELEQENLRLLSRITDLQQDKWILEEKIDHLEQGSSAMAEDLMQKTALIQYYCMERKSDQVSATASTSSPSTERLSSMKKFVEMFKGDEHVQESNRKMHTMLEEMLMKNMQLQNDLQKMSQEVERLSKGSATT